MVFHWLKSKFFGVRGTNSPPVVLPDDVLAAIQHGKAYPISGFIDWACNQSNAAHLIDRLRTQINVLAWIPGEQDKFETYVKYFSRDYQAAFDVALPFLSDESFDPDYFGVAAMALFNTNQFDHAYNLLKRIKKHEHLLIGNFDYKIAAALICWSAGDRYLTNYYVDLGTRGMTDAGMMAFNALAMYFELNDYEGYRRVKDILPSDDSLSPSFLYSLGFIELAKNNYEDGFAMVESRYQLPEAYRYMRAELLARPRWQRESIQGKRLLIHGEQGLGDMIQTARFFGDCQHLANGVIVECPPESIALLKHNFPMLDFVALNTEKAISVSFDVWVGTLSLPYVFDVRHDSIPGRAGYLAVPPDHASYWKKSVEGSGRSGAVKIGVAWSGYPGHRADHRRSIPWHLFHPLLEEYPEVDFFAVQIKVPSDLPDNVHDCTEEMATLSDTAALISQMDLIISVDTSVVHLAGAIGKETWMMLPYRYEWRWGLEGEWNPWYDSVQVIRQPSPGAWAPVLSNVFGRRLREFLLTKKEINETF